MLLIELCSLAGYDYRDAASHASSETPRSVTSSNHGAAQIVGEKSRMKTNSEVEKQDDNRSDKSSGSQRSQGSRNSIDSNDNSASSVVLVSSQEVQKEASKLVPKNDKPRKESETIQKRGKTEGKEQTVVPRAKSPSKPSQIPRLSLQSGKESPGKARKDTSYKDEKWATKVTGVLDSVAKRQSLSARVATILATAPPASSGRSGNNTSSERNTPVSRLSSQGLDSSKITSPGTATPKHDMEEETAASTMVTDMLTPRTEPDLTPRTDPELTPRTEDFMLAKEAKAVERLLQISKQAAPSVSSTDEDRKISTYSERSLKNRSPALSTTTSEDEDVERITGEYKSILKGVTEAVETGQDINILRAKLTSEERIPTGDHQMVKERSNGLSKDAQELLDYKDVHDVKNKGADSVVSDASLDEDVKRILAKYGRQLADGDQEENGRQSPAGSAYETDDTLSHRVQKLLKKPEPRKVDVAQAEYQNYDPMKSLTLHSEVTDSLCPGGLGSLQQRIDEAKYGDDRMSGKHSGGHRGVKGSHSVSDTLNERVRNILADDDEEDATSRQVSSIGSRSQSRSSSVDYRNLEKDLDEIQSNLESLKGDVSSSRRSSDVSERSAELRRFIEQKGGEDDETLKKTRQVLEEQELTDYKGQRLEPEGHGRSPPVHAAKLPLSPILTSGVIPMDVALDMIHGDPYSKYNGYSLSPSGQSGYSNRTIDTETLLKDAGYQDGLSSDAPASRDDSGHPAWTPGNEALVGLAPSKMESLTDREVREINGVGNDTTLDSFSDDKLGQSKEKTHKQAS